MCMKVVTSLYGFALQHCLHSCGCARNAHSAEGQELFPKYYSGYYSGNRQLARKILQLKALGTRKASTSSSIFNLVTPATT